jgi:8-oxo-dGTP pyrophosphatase MutT (NUDIX family)
MGPSSDDAVVRAAGGILWRPGPDGRPEIAVVHRPRYDDWSLPKGKLDDGETHEEAALREVREETGFRCRRGAPAGVTEYADAKGRPKVVRYWEMEPIAGEFEPTAEVDELRWLSVPEARRLLTYDHDRELLKRWRPASDGDEAG